MATIKELKASFTAKANGMKSTIQDIKKDIEDLGKRTQVVARQINDDINSTGKKLSDVGKGAVKGFATELDSAFVGAGKSARNLSDTTSATATSLSGLGNVSSSVSTNLTGVSSAMVSLANGSTVASTGVQNTADNLSGLGAVGVNAASNLQNAGSAIANVGGESAAASSGLNNMASSAANAANSTQQVATVAGQVSQETTRASTSIRDMATSLGLVAVASKVFGVLKSAVDGAVKRFDTLNGFPVIMNQMGFSAEESTEAINKLSSGIDGLPTTLDTVASTTQKLASMTKDLDGAVNSTLALNNAFIASGSDAANASRGLIQYTQMLSTGKVDMMSWKTLQETMGIALNDVAEAFGFAGESLQNDLYAALKSGEIPFKEFNEKIIELDKGVGGFAERAKIVSGGIGVSFGNLRNAAVKGIADILKSFNEISKDTTGKEIYEHLDSLKVVVNASFKAIGSIIQATTPVVAFFITTTQSAIPVVKALTPAIVGLVAAFAAYTVYSKASAAITAAKTAIDAARASTLTLTIATNARVASQVIADTTDRAGTAVTVAQTGAITLKTFAIGVMTGAIKLSAAAQIVAATATKAWGVAIQLFAGPIGWVTLAVGALVTGVIAAVKWFNRSTEEGAKLTKQTEDLASATDSLNNAVEDTAKAYKKRQGSIASTAQANTDLIAKIEKLMAVESKSAAQKKELQTYVDMLNGSVEGLGLAYSKEADALNMSSEQMAAKVKLMKEQESLTASEERFLEISKEQHEVDMRLKDVIALKEEWKQGLEDETVAKGEAKEETEKLSIEEAALMETKAQLAAQQKETEVQITASIEAVAEATANSVDDQILSYDRLEDYQRDIVDSLQSKWHEYKDIAANMFDTISDKSEVTAKMLKENLDENQRVMTDWSENIAALAKRSIDEGLLNELREAGPEAAGLVKNLVNSSDEELKELSTSFEKVGEVAMSGLKKSIGDENAEVFDSVSHLVTATGDSFSEQIQKANFASIGKAIPESAAKGVKDGTPAVSKAAEEMVKQSEKAARDALKVNSSFEEVGASPIGLEDEKSLAAADKLINWLLSRKKGVVCV